MRRLFITFRDVPSDRTELHRREWNVLRDAVLGAGGKAWVFRAETDATRVVEFMEYRGGAIMDLPAVKSAAESLDRAFPEFERTAWVPAA